MKGWLIKSQNFLQNNNIINPNISGIQPIVPKPNNNVPFNFILTNNTAIKQQYQTAINIQH